MGFGFGGGGSGGGSGGSGAGLTISANASGSDSDSKGATYSNAVLSSGGLLSVIAKQDLSVIGGNLSGQTAKVVAGRDFTLASVQGTSDSSSNSWGVSASVTICPAGVCGGSINVSAGASSGSRAWTDKPSSLTTSGALDITVGQQTSVLAALINSDSGKLNLTTNTLVTKDYIDRDAFNSWNFSAGFSTGGGANLSFDIQDRGKDGITRATIGLGNVTIKGVTPEAAKAALDQINRDPTKLQEVLRSHDFAAGADLDLQALVQLPENIQKLAKAFEALSAPIPDDVSAMGPEAERLYRLGIARGKSAEELAALVASGAFERILTIHSQIADASERYANDPERRAQIMYLLGQKAELIFDPSTQEYAIKADCAIASPTPCGVPLSKLGSLSESQVRAFIDSSLDALRRGRGDEVSKDEMKAAFECAIAWKLQGGSGAPLADLVAATGNNSAYDELRVRAAAAEQVAALPKASWVDPGVDKVIKSLNQSSGTRGSGDIDLSSTLVDTLALARINPEAGLAAAKMAYLSYTGPGTGSFAQQLAASVLLQAAEADPYIGDGFKKWQVETAIAGEEAKKKLWQDLNDAQTPSERMEIMRKAGILDEAMMATISAMPGIAILATRFISNARVLDIKTGKEYVGTVDLEPTYSRIARGEQYPHKNDGSVFQNRPPPGQSQALLPVMPKGHYTEYVVPSPMMQGVGPQRLVIGKGGETFYTPDHYGTFIRVK